MNTRTPYEQQLAEDLKHLSLPDEDKAWAAMQRLLDSPEEAAAMGRAARRRFESHFTASHMARSYQAAYRELLAARR